MKYKFPVIEKFSDIEHALDPAYFIVADRGDHKIVNYVCMTPDTFPEIIDGCNIAEIRREFRGLIFDVDGKLIRRPLHKFFNVGEKTSTQLPNMDISNPHLIYTKLDGSMVAFYRTNECSIWGTKLGNTDIAKQIKFFVDNKTDISYKEFANDLFSDGYTTIFEWLSRSNRIVIDNGPEDKLILTAIRNMKTGQYVDIHNFSI